MTTAKTVMLGSLKEDEIRSFHEKVMLDVSAMSGAACAALGDRLGLYRAMAVSGPVTPAELAENTGLDVRYLGQWLINQAAGGYITYDSADGRFNLPAEHAVVLADENSAYFAAGGFQAYAALVRAVPRIAECFKKHEGMAWGEHDVDLFMGTERLFRPVYVNQLVSMFVPAIKGLKERLEKGIKAADIGCGHGISTIELAKAFPKSTFYGFDNHAPSIERAKQRAHGEGVSDRVFFELLPADKVSGHDYGLVAFFDCLHDMGDPVAACRAASAMLAPDGCAMVVEPMGGNTVEENFNSIGRTFSGASVLCCTPNAVASGKHALGTIAPDAELEKVAREGGFKTFTAVLKTPFNRVFEGRR